MSLPVVRYIMFLPSQYCDIIAMVCPWVRFFLLTCFTCLRCKWVPGRTEMAMRLFSSPEMASAPVQSQFTQSVANDCVPQITWQSEDAKWLQLLYAPKKGVEMIHECTGPVIRGDVCETHRALYVHCIRTHHYCYTIKLASVVICSTLFLHGN